MNSVENSKYDWSNKRILILDDEPFTHSLLKKVLEATHVQLEFCTLPQDAINMLLLPDHGFDLILVDLHMPEINGLEVIQTLEKSGAKGDIPFVILSASHSPVEKVDVFENRGADFIQKPFYRAELIARLNMHMEIHDLTRQLKAKVEDLENLAWVDQLTNLANRRACLRRLENEVGLKDRHDRKLGILMIDLDRFKSINDTYGHYVGDEVLIDVSALILEPLRNTDVASRYGGEEFVVILPEVDIEGAEIAATKILESLRNNPYVMPGEESSVLAHTASIGIAVTSQGDKKTSASLLKEADDNLYKAKRSGRDCFVSSTSS